LDGHLPRVVHMEFTRRLISPEQISSSEAILFLVAQGKNLGRVPIIGELDYRAFQSAIPLIAA
jgi:hypothetical protein